MRPIDAQSSFAFLLEDFLRKGLVHWRVRGGIPLSIEDSQQKAIIARAQLGSRLHIRKIPRPVLQHRLCAAFATSLKMTPTEGTPSSCKQLHRELQLEKPPSHLIILHERKSWTPATYARRDLKSIPVVNGRSSPVYLSIQVSSHWQHAPNLLWPRPPSLSSASYTLASSQDTDRNQIH